MLNFLVSGAAALLKANIARNKANSAAKAAAKQSAQDHSDAIAANATDNANAERAAVAQREQAFSDGNSARALDTANAENQFVNLRAAAEKGGFNPLSVLGVPSFFGALTNPFTSLPSSIPNPVGFTPTAAQTRITVAPSADPFASAISGLGSFDWQSAFKSSSLAPSSSIRPRANPYISPTPVKSVKASIGATALSRAVSLPKSLAGAFGYADGSATDPEPLFATYVTSSGEIVRVPLGPDIDEVISGVAINAVGAASAATKYTSEMLYDDVKTFGATVYGQLQTSLSIASARRAVMSATAASERLASRKAAVSKYQSDLAAGRVPALSYIKPLN